MSPEQVRGEAADLRSDLYSLGISLYEMVTGQRPFKADSDYAIMAAHVKEAPRPPIELQPGLPGSLNSIILLSIAKEKEGRFQSADAFRNALSNVQAPAGEQKTTVRTSTFVAAGPTPLPTPARPSATAYSQPAAPAAPSVYAAPAASIPPPPPEAARSGNRGLYMALGAFLALALLVAAGSYYKSGAARSAQETAPAASTQQAAPTPTAAAPATDASAAPSPTTPAPSTPAPSAADAPSTPPAKQTPAPDNSAEKAAAAERAAAAAAKAKAEAELKAALDELETQVDQLTSRALSVDTGLETLRQQQRRAGYDLRGDITTKQEAMKNNLAKARDALSKNDVARGKRFADMTETVLGQLEKFLGR
jgi:serine/threonine-protein kinase